VLINAVNTTSAKSFFTKGHLFGEIKGEIKFALKLMLSAFEDNRGL